MSVLEEGEIHPSPALDFGCLSKDGKEKRGTKWARKYLNADRSGKVVSNANVDIRSIKTIKFFGISKIYSISTRGTYPLTVTNVTKSGYVFAAAGSIIQRAFKK
jgi:hypothetical protein